MPDDKLRWRNAALNAIGPPWGTVAKWWDIRLSCSSKPPRFVRISPIQMIHTVDQRAAEPPLDDDR
ncbi:MAG: hypothetical protein ABIR60_02560, partial [Allosphingosinicella sp.]